jgi:hypothetical protein
MASLELDDTPAMASIEPPPAYEALAPQDGEVILQATLSDYAQIDRIRRFLLFCLLVDYGIDIPMHIYLYANDWSYFMRLAKAVKEEETNRRKHGVRARDMRQGSDSQVAHTDFYKPVWSLAIPMGTSIQLRYDCAALRSLFAGIARSLLTLFPRRTGANGEHVSVLKRNNVHTTSELATRILVDREILFDSLLDSDSQTDLRNLLERANRQIQDRYFESLLSPEQYILTDFGKRMEDYFNCQLSSTHPGMSKDKHDVHNKLRRMWHSKNTLLGYGQ